jgi:hypothetical protein
VITLTGGQFQDASGNLLKKGYLSLQLTQDAAIIAGGQIIRNIPLLFPIANGSLSGSTKIYSNAELTGSTQYLALVLDANQKRVNDPQVWQFTQGTGATVDLGTIVPVSGGVAFAAPVLLAPTGTQTITGFDLILATASLRLDSTHLVKWNNDTGLSRDSAGVIDVGNGTQGDTSGSLKLTRVTASGTGGQSSSSFIASANGSPGIAFNSTGGAADQKWADCFLNTTTFALRFVNDANSVANAFMTVSRGAGAAVGAMTFGAGGGVQALFTSTDTIVGQSTTDTLKNKNLLPAGSGNAVDLIDIQDPGGAVTNNGSDQTIYTKTLSAGQIGPGKSINVRWGVLSSNAVAVTYKLILGATTIQTFTSGAAIENVQTDIDISNNVGVQNIQHVRYITYEANTIPQNGITASAATENTANSLTLKLVTNAASGTVTGKFWKIKLEQ